MFNKKLISGFNCVILESEKKTEKGNLQEYSSFHIVEDVLLWQTLVCELQQ